MSQTAAFALTVPVRYISTPESTTYRCLVLPPPLDSLNNRRFLISGFEMCVCKIQRSSRLVSASRVLYQGWMLGQSVPDMSTSTTVENRLQPTQKE